MTQREAQLFHWIEENPLISQQELADRAGITRSSVAVHISNLMKKGHIVGKGYLTSAAPYAVVVGAVNMDIGGWPDSTLVLHDSNPGKVRISLGGVGRNIAHNMSLLGLDVRMITALGEDLHARTIASSCADLGIDLSQSLQVPGGTTSTYLFITGPEGDMELAVNDMGIYTHLTPAVLASRLHLLNHARLVIADTNLPTETILWMAEQVRAPLFVDPVSTVKAAKLKPILGALHTLKPNRIEAELLSEVAITDEESLHRAATALLDTGLNRVFISLGGDGVYAADRHCGLHVPCGAAKMVNTTGCGDAFMAALAWSFFSALDLKQSAQAGLAASAIAMEGLETINPALSPETLQQRAGF